MAAKKKGTRKKAAKSRSGLARLEAELPPTLRQYAKRVRRGLTRIERNLERAGTRARRQGTRLLREASHELGRLEAWGEARWRKLAGRSRKTAADLLRRLERAVEPRARKKTARKKAARKKAGRKKTTRKKAARKKATRTRGARSRSTGA